MAAAFWGSTVIQPRASRNRRISALRASLLAVRGGTAGSPDGQACGSGSGTVRMTGPNLNTLQTPGMTPTPPLMLATRARGVKPHGRQRGKLPGPRAAALVGRVGLDAESHQNLSVR